MADGNDLNGLWRLTFQYPPPLVSATEAYVIVLDGRAAGVGAGGCTFAGTVTLQGNDLVRVDSIWDASRAKPGIGLPSPSGALTTGSVPIAATLNLVRAGTRLVISGTTNVGPLPVDIHLDWIGGLP